MPYLNPYFRHQPYLKLSFILLLAISSHQASAHNGELSLLKDGVIKDEQQQLLWQACPWGQTWQDSQCKGSRQALDWTEAMRLSNEQTNQTDWRLPTQPELKNFLKAAASQAKINSWYRYLIKTEPGEQPNFYWSSTIGNGYQTGAWGIQADTQSGHFYFRSTPGWVLMVKQTLEKTPKL
ncbi:DUF1566 domain-containing protein [Thiosulfativibrio zosterae]|uniref:Lcl C-terminal domain-containing protein n=1 Tax=Thiosulfativibrio zosterae TaxID=2675053 RepID=A0A6F8PPX7_9GAMM|nr:DUF1566 domain-containing protein [Thiosulfativibrio zosterae]BBP44136.1 hypothetical protein THMIRHAT_18820 [Thiosulfativibrio zosterae]